MINSNSTKRSLSPSYERFSNGVHQEDPGEILFPKESLEDSLHECLSEFPKETMKNFHSVFPIMEKLNWNFQPSEDFRNNLQRNI